MAQNDSPHLEPVAVRTGAKDLILIIGFWVPNDGAVAIGQSLGHGLAALGLRVEVVSTGAPDASTFWGFDPAEVVACITIGGEPTRLEIDGTPLHRLVSCPFYLWMVDTFIYELLRPTVRRFLDDARRDARLGFLVSDRKMEGLFRSIAGPGVWVGFVPFWGHYTNPFVPALREPRIGVFATTLVLSRLNGPLRLRDVVRGANPLRLNERALIDLAGALTSVSAGGNVLLSVMEHLALEPQALLDGEVLHWLAQIDSFEKRRRRLVAASQLRGLPVDFFGLGWKEWFEEEKSFRFYPLIPFSEVAPRMRERTVVLNFDPNWDAGFHDRVYTAVGMGCRVLTPANSAADETPRPRGSIAFYNATNPVIGGAAAQMLKEPPLEQAATSAFAIRNSSYARAHALLQITGGFGGA